jgi:hypothetical protein
VREDAGQWQATSFGRASVVRPASAAKETLVAHGVNDPSAFAPGPARAHSSLHEREV